jgi:AcrR family transcriptional regulator
MTVNPDKAVDSEREGEAVASMDDQHATEQHGTGLPASLEAAWGLRERPHKGPKPNLSLDRIVAAGVRVASSEGLAAVSMSRVAAELGAATMSLYRYVAAKDELLDLMVDAAFGPPPPLPGPEQGWRAGLSAWAWASRTAQRRHPWALRLPISGPPASPNQVAWMEALLGTLRGTRLTEAEKASTMLLLSTYVRGEAALSVDIEAAMRAADGSPQEIMPRYARLLRMLTDRDGYPALHAVLDAGVLDADDAPDDEFVFGLDRILDGIEALVRTRSAPG